MADAVTAALARLSSADAPPFALLVRPEAPVERAAEILMGEVVEVARLADMPVAAGRTLLAAIPFRQAIERGFDVNDDHESIIVLDGASSILTSPDRLVETLGDHAIDMSDARFEPDDARYEEIVARVIDEAIARGEGANFVMERRLVATIHAGSIVAAALSLFRQLMRRERGAYWTFLFYTGERVFVGASPERHVSLADGIAVMNPISGTYRYPPGGASVEGVLQFLGDQKESGELCMVLDEELKMMATVCDDGGTVVGPRLREMAHLAHTEYVIEGRTSMDARDILRATMFAPTIAGSPLENAFRVIRRYEGRGRGFYGGVIARIEMNGAGQQSLDSAIMIRTADIGRDGTLSVGVGATIVRDSEPSAEVAETRAKAAGMVQALHASSAARLDDHPDVRDALLRRNNQLSGFWLARAPARVRAASDLAGKRALVVDAEDTFTFMLARQLEALGLTVAIAKACDAHVHSAVDLTVLGPGPGNPMDQGSPRMAALRRTIQSLLFFRHPFLAICLSHQILCLQLGLEVVARTIPNQGLQKKVEFLGQDRLVGFYNSFEATSAAERLNLHDVGSIAVARDPSAGAVHGLRGEWFASTQFHPESILTRHGPDILADLARHVLASVRHQQGETLDA
jgi:2-amino-4-deoxychorismate synthase